MHCYDVTQVGGLINMVKVLQAAPEHLVETYALLMPAGAQNVNDFTRLCEMKVGCGQVMCLACA